MSDAIRDATGARPQGDATVLDPEAGHVTIINTYMVEPERADELVAFPVEGSCRPTSTSRSTARRS
jgi:hypothetical protein